MIEWADKMEQKTQKHEKEMDKQKEAEIEDDNQIYSTSLALVQRPSSNTRSK